MPLTSLGQGVLGSLLMLAGSLGAGWLAPSSELRRLPLMIWLRLEPAGVILSVVLLTAGSMLLVWAWLRFGQALRQCSGPVPGQVRAAVLLWSTPLFFAAPLFSRDIYAYLAQGKMMAVGLNPYEAGYMELSDYRMLGADSFWAENPTPYGPVFLWIAEAVFCIGGANAELSVLQFRMIAAVGLGLCLYFVPKLAALHGLDQNRALWLSAANPLVLTTFIASGHNDALMVGLALAALYLVATGHPLAGTLVLALSVGIKPISLIFLPFIGLLWAGRNAGWGRKLGCWSASGCLCFGLLGLMGWINGFGFGWIAALGTPGSVWIWYAPIGLLGMLAGIAGSAVGAGELLTGLVHKAGMAAALLAVLWQTLKGDHSRLVRRLALAFTAVVLLSPMIQAWYVAWLIPLFAVTGIAGGWQERILYVLVMFFSIYGVSDQLDVLEYSGVPLTFARCLAAVLALGIAAYLAVGSGETKTLFLGRPDEPRLKQQLG